MAKQFSTSDNEGRLTLVALWGLVVFGVLLVGVVSFYQIQISDPYIKNVLARSGDSIKGHAIFQINCSGCHGLHAQGKVGPSLHQISKRRSRVSLIKQVISGRTPPMPQFNAKPQEMADLLLYLESL